MSDPISINNSELFEKASVVLSKAKQSVLNSINQAMTLAYFEVGHLIIEEEQYGYTRAEYGKQLLKELSVKLLQSFGRGFSVDNLENMRLFYLVYGKSETVSRKFQEIGFDLNYSHYVQLCRIEDEEQRDFYEKLAIKEKQSVREMKRSIETDVFHRVLISTKSGEFLEASNEKQLSLTPKDIIRDPYILEFLGLKEEREYSESDLEQAIIDNIEKFLLELGKGYAFVARQKRISLEGDHFYIDLVFYNYLLKCFVLIDLKVGELKHQDLGQLQMYVNYYDREMKSEDDIQTIGIILCANKKDSIVKYTLPEDNTQIFASKYKLYLPSKEELEKQIKNTIDQSLL